MQILETLPFKDIESIPLLIKDFLKGNVEYAKEYVYKDDNILKSLNNKKENYSSMQRLLLSKVIDNQHTYHSRTLEQKKNIDKISQENCFTITTGHQLNLFTGPVFFIYKILQTIKTAKELSNKFPDHQFVPLFWMATEDHDFEEIHHFKTKKNIYQISEIPGNAVGEIKITDLSFIENFVTDFRNEKYGEELIELMKQSYTIGSTLSMATRRLVNALFSQYGLLILDANDVELKSTMIDIFEEELLKSKMLHNTQSKVDLLIKDYGKVQVNPREINLFYLENKRHRIEKTNNQFHLVDTDIYFSEAQFLSILKTNPERFSPNALMRPVFQEKILPNIMYIGGNAEIMYWLELVDYFKSIKLPFPILTPRNSMLILSKKWLHKLEKLKINIPELLMDVNELINSKIIENNAIRNELSILKNSLEKQFQTLQTISLQTDKTFGNLVKAEETRQKKSFFRLQKRLLRAEKIKQTEYIDRIRNIFYEIHPGGNWQERNDNFSVFFSKKGKDWLQDCYDLIPVNENQLLVVEF